MTSVVVEESDLQDATKLLNQGKKGPFSSDNRAGISGTLHRISAIKNRDSEVVGLTYR